MNELFKRRREMNKNWIKQYVVPLLKQNKIVVLLGLSFGFINAEKQFVIKVNNYEQLYRRVYIRTLDEIEMKSAEIRKLLNSGEHPEVRQDFIGPYFSTIASVNRFYSDHTKRGYKVATFEKIKDSILTMTRK